jgi:predicted phosphodiesterase
MVRRLVVPDAHWPFADKAAFGVMLQAAKDYKPHEIVVLGDWQDVYCLSRFDKNPEKVARDLEEELGPGIAAFHEMNSLLKPKKIYFIVGNHTWRIERYIHSFAPMINSIIPNIRELYQLPKNTEVIPYGKFLELENGVNYCHGISTGKTCTAKMLDMLGTTVVMGHTHRAQMSTKRHLNGKVITAYSMGWLGDFSEADYIQHADWVHAFGTATTIGSRTSIQIHEISNRGVVLNDKEFTYKKKASSR